MVVKSITMKSIFDVKQDIRN